MDGYNFHSMLTSEGLVTEVAGGTFAFKNKIKAYSVKLLWEKLGFFIAETLKSQKGVLLPNLGSFKVGPVVGESKKKIRVAFSLLEGRYGSVSQERPKFIIGGKAPVVQPSYGLLSTAAAVHRGSGQRLIAELLQRLGVHILSSRPIKVDFPCLGKLVTNRVGRIEFVFDPLLAEFFEREQFAIVKEMQYSPADYEIEKGLQAVTLDDPPLIKSPRGLARPVSAISGISRRDRLKQQVHAPYKGSLLDLMKLCRESDRTLSGCVPRLALEQWLHQQCRSLLALIDAGTLMDLIDKHTYGKTNKQIVYRKFLDALDAALAKATGFQGSSPAASPRAVQHARQQQQPWDAEDNTNEEGPHEDGFGQGQDGAAGQRGALRAEASAQDLILQLPQSPALSRQAPEPDAYLHYCQNQLSPRSRTEYDAFNRAHFEHLYSERGSKAAKRAVTPKVGEEPLNLQEYQAVRSASPQAVRGRTPAFRGDTPYGHVQQQQPWAQAAQPFAQAPQQAWAQQSPYQHQHEGWAPQPLEAWPQQAQPQQQQQQQQQEAWAQPAQPRQQQQPQQPQQQEAWMHQAPPRHPQQQEAWAQQAQPRQQQQQQQEAGAPPSKPYSHQPQIMQLLNPSSANVSPRSEAPRAPGRGHEQQYNILAPPPLPQRARRDDAAPLSQYDILKEPNRAVRAQLKEEYAAALQEGWEKQIKEKEELQGVLEQKEQLWPFGPVGVPMDKRPVSAISRPPVSPRRSNRTPR